MSEILFLVKDSLDGGYEAEAVGHSIYTQCEEGEDIKDYIRDAVICHFEDKDLPGIIRVHFVKFDKIQIDTKKWRFNRNEIY